MEINAAQEMRKAEYSDFIERSIFLMLESKEKHFVGQPIVVKPEKVRNYLYKYLGAGILLLNKPKHLLKGYTAPRTFPMSDYEKAAEYDIGVVENWLFYLSKYVHHEFSLKEKSILELGPGADLGVGLYLLYRGARQYHAIDVNPLIESVPQGFYDYFFSKLENIDTSSHASLAFLRSQLERTHSKNNDRLNYVCRRDFDLSIFAGQSIDIVFSQAAFEHFDDVEETIGQLSRITEPGAVLIAEVDLKTHSRWIRAKDPLNIYRYTDTFYNLCKFRGSPNRLRPCQYTQFLTNKGWGNIQIFPNKVLDEEYLAEVRRSLNRKFQHPEDQMEYLSMMLCATKR